MRGERHRLGEHEPHRRREAQATQALREAALQGNGAGRREALTRLSEGLGDLVAEVAPAVVHLHTWSSDGRWRPVVGAGSSVLVAPEGIVVTNHHVLERAEGLEVVLAGGERLRRAS